MRVAIYILAFLETVLLLFFVAQYASGSGGHGGGSSGGPEMALFFLVLLPLAVVLGATAVFHYTRWPVLRWTAAVVIAVPLLAMGAIAGLR